MIGKRGNILTENVVFIIITILFIAALFVFVSRASSQTGIIEEVNAKKIALLIDSARPGAIIRFNIEKILDKKDVEVNETEVFRVEGNRVFVRLSSESEHYYNFYNNIKADLKIVEENEFKYLQIAVKEKEVVEDVSEE